MRSCSLEPNLTVIREGLTERKTALEDEKRHIDKTEKNQNAALDHCPVRDQYLTAVAKDRC